MPMNPRRPGVAVVATCRRPYQSSGRSVVLAPVPRAAPYRDRHVRGGSPSDGSGATGSRFAVPGRFVPARRGTSPGRGVRERAVAGLVAVGVLVTGLAGHLLLPGLVGKYLGDVLYASLVYLLLVVVVPRRPGVPAALGLAWCFGVEFLQLTPVPDVVAARLPRAYFVLGSRFNAPDLLMYVVGTALAAGVRALSRSLRPVQPPVMTRARGTSAA